MRRLVCAAGGLLVAVSVAAATPAGAADHDDQASDRGAAQRADAPGQVKKQDADPTATGAGAGTPDVSPPPASDPAPAGHPTTSGTLDQPQPLSTADRNPGGANGQCPGGAYCSTRSGLPSGNGNGNGNAVGKPCAGCVGKADNKNPPGQRPDGTDHNKGYECDGNHGVGRTNPAHTGCARSTTPPPSTPPPSTPQPSTPPKVTPPPKVTLPPSTPPPSTPPAVTPPPVVPECVPAPGENADCAAVEGEKNGPGDDRPTSRPPAAPVRVLAETGGNGVPGLVTVALLSLLAGCLLLAAAAHGRPGRR